MNTTMAEDRVDALVAAVGDSGEEPTAGPAGTPPKSVVRARARIDALLCTLAEDEQTVLRQVYGLDGAAATLADTGECAGLSVAALRGIAEQVLAKLRQPERYPVAFAA